MIFKRGTPLPLLSVHKIWDKAEHSAFPDLLIHKDELYCAFREGETHQGTQNGALRILKSRNATTWTPAALINDPVADLRDPKLSTDPIGRLVLNCGALIPTPQSNLRTLSSMISFSTDGVGWSRMKPIVHPHEWLWRLTWRRGYAYGVSYRRVDPHDKRSPRVTTLYRTQEGVHFEAITEFEIPGFPSETTLRFREDETMVALVRRDGRDDRLAWIGESAPPYTEWRWLTLSMHVGGPNFLIMPDENLLISGRLLTVCPYGFVEKTFLGQLNVSQVDLIQVLPSGLDCSYPGMAIKDDILYICYYSSHEGKSCIYLARFGI